MPDWKNKLYFGDNLEILRDYIAPESVDLVYLDPPFNSQATYNVLFKEANGAQAASQIKAFEDFWHWEDAAPAYHEVVSTGPPQVAKLLSSLHDFLGHNDMMAYLAMMAIRLVELHRVLKPTGSLYLHCDPTASHYLKLVLDAVFDVRRFRNEIVWKRASTVKGNVGQGSKLWGQATDSILFYTKSDEYVFHQPFKPYTEHYTSGQYRFVEPETGRRYRLVSMIGPGGASKGNPQYEVMGVTRYWRYSRLKMQELVDAGLVVQTRPGAVPHRKYYLDEGKGVSVQSLWDDIGNLQASAHERLGYPTQKPEALLERIIKASSNEGDLVLDPFCGCGTTIAVAERLHRRWIGIDITHLAIALMRTRLEHSFGGPGTLPGQLNPYEVIGEPQDLESARALFRQDPYQFQYWALSLVRAQTEGEPQKGADKGIDGWQYFFDDDSGKAKRIVISVKGGGVTRSQVGYLISVMHRENAELGVFITLETSTRPMRDEAAECGICRPPNQDLSTQLCVPRIQILTIEELLAGKTIELPPSANATFERAPRQFKAKPQAPQIAME